MRNAVSGEAYDWSDIKTKLEKVSSRYFDDPKKGTYIVEELLTDHNGNVPPPDVRAYSFFGEIGMIQIDHHLRNDYAESMYFDGNFQPFEDTDERYGVATGAKEWQFILPAKRSPNWRSLIEIAKRISIIIPTAFCRVDMYDTPNGVYLGEITFFRELFTMKMRNLCFQRNPKGSENYGKMLLNGWCLLKYKTLGIRRSSQSSKEKLPRALSVNFQEYLFPGRLCSISVLLDV